MSGFVLITPVSPGRTVRVKAAAPYSPGATGLVREELHPSAWSGSRRFAVLLDGQHCPAGSAPLTADFSEHELEPWRRSRLDAP